MLTKYAQETIEISRSKDWASIIDDEIGRLIKSGMINQDDHSRAMVIGVALENIADNYLRGYRKTKEYRNMLTI